MYTTIVETAMKAYQYRVNMDWFWNKHLETVTAVFPRSIAELGEQERDTTLKRNLRGVKESL